MARHQQRGSADMATSLSLDREQPGQVVNSVARPLRQDLRLIADLVRSKARVLDVGCGDGALLGYLAETKAVDGRGIELSRDGVKECLSRGLSVVQGDAEKDLHLYPDASFDYVILSQTIQAMRRPDQIIDEMLRIGRFGIVSFVNYAHWRARWRLVRGRMPRGSAKAEPWYASPNIRPCTLEDFEQLAAKLGLEVERRICLASNGQVSRLAGGLWFDNLLSAQALFMLSRKASTSGLEQPA
jgi:methionine biosynthesis protein MetW